MLPFGIEGMLGGAYLYIGQPERWVEWCRAQLARGRDTHVLTGHAWLSRLAVAGSGEEAMAAANGLIEAAEATRNPSCALVRAPRLRLSLSATPIPIARVDAAAPGSGDRSRQRQPLRRDPSWRTSWPASKPNTATPLAAFDHFTLAIRNFHDAGDTTTIRVPLAVLAALFDRLGRYEPAATIAGFALSPFTAVGVPEISTAITHLRNVLGDETYESLARKGETMTTAAMVTYAYDQIDQARAELNAVSK